MMRPFLGPCTEGSRGWKTPSPESPAAALPGHAAPSAAGPPPRWTQTERPSLPHPATAPKSTAAA
eukprot:10697639-Alexandrium_andersonii.AAC.1